MGILHKIGFAIFAAGSFIAGLFGYHLQQFGSNPGALPNVVANFSDSLAAQMATTDSSFTLVSGLDSLSRSLQGLYCFTIDAQTSNSEFVCGNASGTSITNVTRGIDPLNWNATSSVLTFIHRRGASVAITDYTSLGAITRLLNGSDTLANALVYQTHSPCSTSASTTLVDYTCVTGVATSGAPDAGIGGKGLVQLATPLQLAKGATSTIDGTQILYYAPAAQNFSSTSTATSAVAVVAQGIGNSIAKIDPGFINTSSSYTWTGQQIIQSTTISGFAVTSTSFSKFGGTGSDGALSITAGTTTVSLGGAKIFVKNYSSISITGTGALAFNNTSTVGTIIVLKSSGDCTLTSTANPIIDLRRIGGPGGKGTTTGGGTANPPGGGGGGASASSSGSVGGTGSGSAGATGAAGQGFGAWLWSSITGGGGGIPGGTAAGGTSPAFLASSTLYQKLQVIPGSGGGGGGSSAGATTASQGGDGAGALWIECAGALNFTGTINASGTGGVAGNADSGGGGGGGGGSIVILYNVLTANSGSTLVGGGAGSAGGGTGAVGGNGAAGWGVVSQNTEF